MPTQSAEPLCSATAAGDLLEGVEDWVSVSGEALSSDDEGETCAIGGLNLLAAEVMPYTGLGFSAVQTGRRAPGGVRRTASEHRKTYLNYISHRFHPIQGPPILYLCPPSSPTPSQPYPVPVPLDTCGAFGAGTG